MRFPLILTLLVILSSGAFAAVTDSYPLIVHLSKDVLHEGTQLSKGDYVTDLVTGKPAEAHDVLNWDLEHKGCAFMTLKSRMGIHDFIAGYYGRQIMEESVEAISISCKKSGKVMFVTDFTPIDGETLAEVKMEIEKIENSWKDHTDAVGEMGYLQRNFEVGKLQRKASSEAEEVAKKHLAKHVTLKLVLTTNKWERVHELKLSNRDIRNSLKCPEIGDTAVHGALQFIKAIKSECESGRL
jgi:hypothetical protein